jgi:hypothetical protein
MLSAVLVALLSAACYAVSAVLQQRQASRQAEGGAGLVLRLARQPVWWLAVGATIAGALLHVVALALGPLNVVEPPGVTTLAFALPLGAVLARRSVARVEWLAAAAVMFGVATVLAVAPAQAPVSYLPLLGICTQVGGAVGAVLGLLVLAWLLRGPLVPVIRAAAAATCFGTAAVIARVTVTGLLALPIGALLAIGAATSGFVVAQLAYREGGLGPPLATLILVDPLVGVTSGALLLDQPLALSTLHATLGTLGLAITALGIGTLARRPASTHPHAGTRNAAPVAGDANSPAALPKVDSAVSRHTYWE